MTMDCPKCKTDVLVGKSPGRRYRWICYGCDEEFGTISWKPVAYDDVDVWYATWSNSGARLHANRDCINRETAVVTYGPAEARQHRHDRCLACGHEVIES